MWKKVYFKSTFLTKMQQKLFILSIIINSIKNIIFFFVLFFNYLKSSEFLCNKQENGCHSLLQIL